MKSKVKPGQHDGVMDEKSTDSRDSPAEVKPTAAKSLAGPRRTAKEFIDLDDDVGHQARKRMLEKHIEDVKAQLQSQLFIAVPK